MTSEETALMLSVRTNLAGLADRLEKVGGEDWAKICDRMRDVAATEEMPEVLRVSDFVIGELNKLLERKKARC